MVWSLVPGLVCTGWISLDMYVRMGRVDTRCPQGTTVEFGKRRGPLWGTEPHVTSVILDTREPARSTQNFYIHFNLSFIHNNPNSLNISTLAVTSLPNIWVKVWVKVQIKSCYKVCLECFLIQYSMAYILLIKPTLNPSTLLRPL